MLLILDIRHFFHLLCCGKHLNSSGKFSNSTPRINLCCRWLLVNESFFKKHLLMYSEDIWYKLFRLFQNNEQVWFPPHRNRTTRHFQETWYFSPLWKFQTACWILRWNTSLRTLNFNFRLEEISFVATHHLCAQQSLPAFLHIIWWNEK